MASALKLKNDIRKLKTAIDNKATNPKFLPKLKEQLAKLEDDLAKLKKPSKSGKKPYVRAEGSALTKLKNKLKGIEKKYKGYSGKTPLSLERDANRPAKPIGKRKAKSGNTYYEYRANRIDVKQPPKVFPKLEDGGYMAEGGKLKAGVYRVGKPTKVSKNLYEQKIVEIFDNGDISTASDYGRNLSDFKSYSYPIISSERLEKEYKMEEGGYMAKGGFNHNDIKKGDFVNFGSYGNYYVADTDYDALDGNKYFWVVKEEENRKKSSASGKAMLKSNAKYIVEEYASGGYMAKGGKLSLKKFREKYDDNEDRNYHSENVVLLAENFGSESDIRDAKTILAKHEAIGSLPYNLSQERNALHDKLWAKYQEEVREKGIKEDGGYMADGGKLSSEDKVRLAQIEREIKEQQKTIEEFEEDDNETEYDRFGNPSPLSFNQQVVVAAEKNLEKLQEERKNLLKGKKMADGGESQGYDDREDERLSMEHGKISTKDFVGTHSKKEHSRRDDARFEERKMAMGGVAEHGLMKGDHIVDTLEDTLVIENGGKKYYVFIKTGEREEVAEKGGYMTHGGETHRSEKNKK